MDLDPLSYLFGVATAVVLIMAIQNNWMNRAFCFLGFHNWWTISDDEWCCLECGKTESR